MYAGIAAALPTALWRIPLILGFTLGTPTAWREAQDIPGTGTWYLLGLSLVQLAAIACMLALTIEPARLTPHWLRARRPLLVPRVVGIAGAIGALVLALLVTMSIIAWDKVDPFSGAAYGIWGWLCAGCYLLAALWPLFFGTASLRYLMHYRQAGVAAR
ncbi:hypothetical protein GCM10027063_10230 [Promicromonospora xylanilytica]